MIFFFLGGDRELVYAVQSKSRLADKDVRKISWLFGGANFSNTEFIDSKFVGPRASMITPWSTNAVEITQNMGIQGIERIEEFLPYEQNKAFDPMLFQKYEQLNQQIFDIKVSPESIQEIHDIRDYNQKEGLALSEEEIIYLNDLSTKIGRKLTDSEVFAFSQANSEHCRHKIFNGTFVIDGEEKVDSLFKLIKKTSEANPNYIVSAYKDNVAFVEGPNVVQFAPKSVDKADYFEEKPFDSVISLKAETHNFPTTVEPFNGAATGSGGEIRDRLAGGQGSLPVAGTAVYMTAYSRLRSDSWECKMEERNWLYQKPIDILIKASNGASDFGNKFGQPLISGSVLTFEHEEDSQIFGFDKVIMLAGGIGYSKKNQAIKKTPKSGDRIVILGGENYRIGMGGAAVSSADTGAFGTGIELNAIQRSNPEMQKRAANAIRAMVESDDNKIISIHDHGAGGHLNCLSELVEETGGHINMEDLPVGDPTLSAKEIIGNESQERMGLIISESNFPLLQKIAERERSPIYDVGVVSNDHRFKFEYKSTGEVPMDYQLSDFFGSSPKTIMTDEHLSRNYTDIEYDYLKINAYLDEVLKLEAVSCKDWLTNKVDRCVGGRVAKQQCCGPLQLPLNNVGVMALDFKGKEGIATSIGHSPISALVDPTAGSRNSIGEALTNLIWAPLKNGLQSVSLSANWMWPCNNPGEDARLYDAVQGCSDFAIELGINIPTGKDSLSMKQKYQDKDVLAPGTVIISTVAHCSDIKSVVEPVLQSKDSHIYYINFSQDEFKLGGSSFGQVMNKIGTKVPTITNADYFKKGFNLMQDLIKEHKIIAGHDIGSGGLITTLLEMAFPQLGIGAEINLTSIGEKDLVRLLFSENIGIVFQADSEIEMYFEEAGIALFKIGKPIKEEKLLIHNFDHSISIDINQKRRQWYETSYLLDRFQSMNGMAEQRFQHFDKQPLNFIFPKNFEGVIPHFNQNRPKAAIIREKGSNSEREMAHAMYLAGFDVKDIHMTDLISGRETLEDVRFIGAVGGFSNSDVLGSAKGWAGAFLYNEKAKVALNKFFNRKDTLSVGICNGCQLFMELELINPEHEIHGKMKHNKSNKHESAFTSVTIQKNNSVMLGSLEGSTLGVWISHGEGRFSLPRPEADYAIVAKYAYQAYPGNPNDSDFNTAMMCDSTGRHLVMMPHIERSIFPWNWAYYPNQTDHVSPWIEAFINARKWIESSNINDEE